MGRQYPPMLLLCMPLCVGADLFKLLAARESVADDLTQLDVLVVDWLECNKVHLLNVRIAFLVQIIFVAKDVYNLCHDTSGLPSASRYCSSHSTFTTSATR